MKGEVKQAFIISYCEKAISAYSEKAYCAVCQVADGNLDQYSLLAAGDYETLVYASFHGKSFVSKVRVDSSPQDITPV